MSDDRPLVMHVIHHLVIGGMENGLVNVINHLPHDKYRHVVVCIEDYSDFSQRIQRSDVEVFALRRSKVGVNGVRRAVYRLCRQLRPRIVHSRNQSGLDSLLPAWLARVPWRVHGEHGWEMSNLDGRQWKAALLRRMHAPLVHQYVAVSADLARFLVDRIGIDGGRISTICNGVDTDQFMPGSPPQGLSMPRKFLDRDVVRVGTVGRLQPVKDQATLIAAVAQLVDTRRDLRARIRLVLVGDGPLRNALQQQVHRSGIDDITWFAGASSKVSDWLRAMDLFVLPSLNEGISNTLLEAMATGIPVLATPVGGNVELLVDGQCGRLFAPGDVQALVDALASYLDNANMRRAHGGAARLRAEGVFGLRTMVNKYHALYEGLLSRETN